MSHERHKVLIIKLGYSETLLPVVSQACSLGDVFRTTVVLHLFKDDHVTWLTDGAAVPLLEGNPYIDRLLSLDLLSVMQLEGERFDKVINLEKVPGLCALASRINAWSKYGFRFDDESGLADAYERAHEALALATIEDSKKLNEKCWAEVLYSVLGARWEGENYILGYTPTTTVQHDLGFNAHVGKLMPHKAWPAEYWNQLEGLIDGKLTIARQEHLHDLHGYIDWINSCRMLVTNDSLGLYLGIALGKKVLALFGPTPSTDQSPDPNLRILVSPTAPKSTAGFETDSPDAQCIRDLLPQTVYDAIVEWGVN